MAENSMKWLEMTGILWKWLEVAENRWNGWKWLDMAGMAGNG